MGSKPERTKRGIHAKDMKQIIFRLKPEDADELDVVLKNSGLTVQKCFEGLTRRLIGPKNTERKIIIEEEE